MDLNKTEVSFLNIDKTLSSGQTFCWQKIGEFWFGSLQNTIIKIKQINNQIYWQTYPNKDNFELLNKYFCLETNHLAQIEQISTDLYIKKAIENHSGLILLKQDLNQTLISFVLAQNKNIPAIKKSLKTITEKINRKIKIENKYFYFFPSVLELSNIPDSVLINAGLGYRVEYFKNVVNFLENLEESSWNMQNKDFEYHKNKLIQIRGVGDKVADCALVFGMQYKHITPLDIWGSRIVKDLYGKDDLKNYSQMQNFLYSKFGENTAIAGQYLFEWIRNR